MEWQHTVALRRADMEIGYTQCRFAWARYSSRVLRIYICIYVHSARHAIDVLLIHFSFRHINTIIDCQLEHTASYFNQQSNAYFIDLYTSTTIRLILVQTYTHINAHTQASTHNECGAESDVCWVMYGCVSGRLLVFMWHNHKSNPPIYTK